MENQLFPGVGKGNLLESTDYSEFIGEFLKSPLEMNSNPLMFFRAAVYSILFLSSEDPCRLHYQAAREILREVQGAQLESEEKARDLLARSLVKECQLFASLFPPFDPHALSEEKLFTRDGILSLDSLFADHIAKIGPHGKKISAALLTASLGWRQDYVQDRQALALFRLWVDFDIPPYYCRYLKLLAEILWKDRVETQFQKTQKHLPALTLTVQRPLSRLFSSRTHKMMHQEKTTLLYDGKIVAEATLLESKHAVLLAKGIQSLGSIYHHKLLRYECQAGYENWIAGKTSPGVIRFERGETEIAEILGFKFKQAPAIIKALLYVQSRMTFYFDDQSSGHLISLNEFKSPSTSREEGLEITLAAQLMPHYTFQTDRRARLLVPMTSLPPLVSAPQYHAGQVLLQMLIMEEFTCQSLDLAGIGSIEISEEKWAAFAKQCALPISIFNQARYRWLADGEDGPRFLIQVDKNRYLLSEAYAKELKFLCSQGDLRRERQLQAQNSVRKRRLLLKGA